jgi:hypothetical protein
MGEPKRPSPRFGKGLLAMIRLASTFPSDDATDRRWRAAVLWAVHSLRLSVERRRKLSLSNLCRLFEYRWRRGRPQDAAASTGAEAGRTFLTRFYPTYAASRLPADGNGD